MVFDCWIDDYLLEIQPKIQENHFMFGELLTGSCNKNFRYMTIVKTVIFEITLVKTLVRRVFTELFLSI